ncbi:HD domain-containing protein [Sulfolobus sp. S-194]|uniref:HD domain-containing protein n=1 Tax=Sulfolobus sp. S-194 TaxID=2512240 RepID=UPI001436DAB1|nr:HD domain-containing protein [Sulfolobus sp. S-194]QIW22829.1 HD domain-containing protein [Sulfolobus sp. S-194]
MTLRGKLNLPEFKVVFDGDNGKQYEGNTELEEKIINTLTHMAQISCEIAENDEKKAMDIFADIISMLYKLPMFVSYTPISEEESLKYIPTAFEYFFIYTVGRHVTDLSIDKNMSLEEIFKKLENFKYISLLRSLVRNYFSSIKDIYEALINTPADTRPGFNFTSLASHLQLTSLVSWLLQPHSIDLNYLRVASLLHDIGKLIDPRHHVTKAINILREVENNLESTNSCIKLDRVKDLVSSHHADFESIIQKADHLASSADRLTELVVKALDVVEGGKEVKECFNKSHEESYNCFDKLGKEKYEKASKEIYKFILSHVISEDIINNEEAKVFPFIPDRVEKNKRETQPGRLLGYIVYIDLPSIQNFITNFPKLRDMSFASMLVDFLVSVYSFMLLDTEFSKRTKSRLPAEALLSGYGGHSYIVIRKDIGNDSWDIKSIFKGIKLLENLDVKISVSVSDFAYDNYILNYNEVWDKIKEQFSERYLLDFNEEIYSVGLHRVCDNCGIRPASKLEEEFGEKLYLCKRCAEIRGLSSSKGFVSKVKSTYLLYIDNDVKKINPENAAKKLNINYTEYAMEFLAGYKKPEDTKYVSIVKADGNRGSIIFSASATFSDYVDKSFRLDYGVKKAFYDTLVELAKAETEDFPLTSRVLSGVLYLGGDDIAILLPSIIAIPFTVRLFEKAKELTGFTFKLGILSIKPDHPIQFAFQAVDELMEKSKIKPPKGAKDPSVYNKTSIACMVFSSTLASRAVVESEIKRYTDRKTPYLAVTNDIDKVKELLKVVNLYDFKNVIELYIKDDKKGVRDKMRDLEDAVGFAETTNGYTKALAYILRQIARGDRKEVLKKVVKDSESPLSGIPLYDYYFILKTFRVGVG